MAQPDTSRHSGFWRAVRETGSMDSGVVAYPGLEARPQSAAGLYTNGNSRERGGAVQTISSSSSSTPRPTPHPATAMRQCAAEPQARQWYYYDPTRHRLLSSPQLHPNPLAPPTAMSGPPFPPIPVHPGTASPATPNANSPTDAMHEPISTSLKALQSQFTVFQQDLGGVKSDVKDVLSQLHTLRTAHSKTDKCIAELQDVVGVSAAGVRRVRGKRGRGRSRGGNAGITAESPLEVEDADIEAVPEKTLVQSVTSIQSAIEALFRSSQSHLPVEAVLPPTVNHFPGQASFQVPQSLPLQSVINPLQQHLTLQRTQFANAAPSTSSSESLSLPSVAIPTPEFTTSPQPVLLEKEYVDASIQACLPTTSEPSLLSSHGLVPELIPVDWNADPATLGRFADNSVRPTAIIAESLAHFLHDGHLSSAPNTTMDTRTKRDSHHPLRSLTTSDSQLPTRTTSTFTSFSCPNEPVANDLPTAPSPTDNSVVPSPGGTTPVTETSPSPSRTSDRGPVLQTSSPATEGVNSSTKLLQGQSVASQTLLTSPLSSVSSIRDLPMSMSGGPGSEEHVAYPGRPHVGLGTGDAQMTSPTEGNAILVTNAGKTAAGSTPTVLGRRRSPLIDADDEGLTSGLPTPPSETDTKERESRSRADGATTDFNLVLYALFPGSLPVIPTPPSLTPEPSARDDQGGIFGTGGGGSLGVFSELPSPSTPSLLSPSLSPSSAAGSSFAEEGASHGSGQTAAHKVVKEHTNSPGDTMVAAVDDGNVAEGVSADVPMDEAQSDPRKGQAGVEATFARPVIILTKESQSMTVYSEGAPQVHNVCPPGTPTSSVGQPNVALLEHDPSLCITGADLVYSPTINGNGYDFHFSSPRRSPSPPTSSAPSRYATPSEPSDARPAQDHDEDEVWHALMLGGSSVSTPLSDSTSLPMFLSHQPSRASSVHPHTLSLQPLSVDPSLLHARGPDPGSERLLKVSDGSLSPLTSLGDTDVEKEKAMDGNTDSDAAQASKIPPAHVGANACKSRGRSGGSRSEPYRAPSRPASRTLEESVSVVRTASEADVGIGGLLAGRAGSARPKGGPNASVDQLALLARREPLKICLRIPGWMKGVKRKRDGVDGMGESGSVVMAKVDGSADNEHVRSVDKDAQATEYNDVSAGVVLGTDTPTPTASQLAQECPAGHPDAVEHLDAPVPRKRRKRQIKGGEKNIHGARTASDVSENTQPARIGTVASAQSMPTSQLALGCSASSSVVDSAGGHETTSNLPTPPKRTQREGEHRQKKQRQGPKTKPKSPVKCHVRKGQIVTIASEPEPRSHTPVTPSASQPAEADQEPRTPTRTPLRKRQEKHTIKMESLRENPSQPSSRSAGPDKLSLAKEDAWNTISRHGGTWPELPGMFSHWDVQFIQCDNCDKWYHYGCVAIESGDPRLESGVLFICPTCHQSARRQTLRNQGDTCARPDCPEPQVTQDSEIFVVEKIVGRKKCEGYIYMWLAKWEGYPMTQATWIPKENVVGDGVRMFNTFLENAVEEGADLSRDVVLLQEALEAGWDA